MRSAEKDPPAAPKKESPDKEIKEKPTPPEEKPIREPEVKPEVEPSLPNRDLPGREDIPPIKDYGSVQIGYW